MPPDLSDFDAEFLRYLSTGMPVPPERQAEFASWVTDYLIRNPNSGPQQVLDQIPVVPEPPPIPHLGKPTLSARLQPGVLEFRFAANPDHLVSLRDALADLGCPALTCHWPEGGGFLGHTPGCAIETTIRLWDFVLRPVRCTTCAARIAPGTGYCPAHAVACRTCRGAGVVPLRGQGQPVRRGRRGRQPPPRPKGPQTEPCAVCEGKGRIAALSTIPGWP